MKKYLWNSDKEDISDKIKEYSLELPLEIKKVKYTTNLYWISSVSIFHFRKKKKWRKKQQIEKIQN